MFMVFFVHLWCVTVSFKRHGDGQSKHFSDIAVSALFLFFL